MLHVSNTVEEWRKTRDALAGRTIGFVPTMGALHHGHASLVTRCREESEVTVVSIFVNPSQFNDPQDLQKYPRTLESDLAILRDLGVEEVLAPQAQEMYPAGYRFKIQAESITNCMEGTHRPGFFEGVMTVVLKLFNLVRPHRAYFGEKDYQQLKVITEMAAELFLPIEVIPCATVRELSGLALSSRNAHLTEAGRQEAAILFHALTNAPTPGEAQSAIEAAGLTVDYVEEHWGRRFLAAWVEGVRLIDNVPLQEAGNASLS